MIRILLSRTPTRSFLLTSSTKSTSYLNSNLLSSSSSSSSPFTLTINRNFLSSSGSRFNMSSSSSSTYEKVLTTTSINPHVKNVEYAVRGELSNRANRYADWIAEGKGKEKNLPFDSVVTANIGNPQQQPFLAQKPLTFWRQVAALTEYPDLLENEAASKAFPEDVKERAKSILHDIGSVGAYSHSKGAASIRKHVAEFIEKRDGHPSDPELIYLTSGASGGVALLMSILISSPSVGVMIPIPQYPLYSATLSLYDAKPVKYDLNSDQDWGLEVSQMKSSLQESKSKGVDVRACVIINPGNPTGSCLSEENIKDVIKLAHEENLVLFADEVYQTNIYQPEERPFVSFKKVLKDFSNSKDENERKISEDVELISFHSISKGVSGECGRRGGYFELTNISPEVESEIYKMASVSLCPSLQGQIGVDLLVKPPQENEPSFELFKKETQGIHETLKKRSEKMRDEFDRLPNMKCNPAQGALYLFPQVDLPKKALEEAKKQNDGKGIQPDLFYCFELLDATGICVVPGSGFGKMPDQNGKSFFRTTVLAKETDEFIQRFGTFHKDFMKKFAD